MPSSMTLPSFQYSEMNIENNNAMEAWILSRVSLKFAYKNPFANQMQISTKTVHEILA
jgi:hypothetical protein